MTYAESVRATRPSSTATSALAAVANDATRLTYTVASTPPARRTTKAAPIVAEVSWWQGSPARTTSKSSEGPGGTSQIGEEFRPVHSCQRTSPAQPATPSRLREGLLLQRERKAGGLIDPNCKGDARDRRRRKCSGRCPNGSAREDESERIRRSVADELRNAGASSRGHESVLSWIFQTGR
jgi:hypothetical protein